jgi:hypothetical protein
MTDLQFTCLRVAVTLAKTEQIKKVAKLRERLRDHNFDDGDIDAALTHWAKQAKEKQ